MKFNTLSPEGYREGQEILDKDKLNLEVNIFLGENFNDGLEKLIPEAGKNLEKPLENPHENYGMTIEEQEEIYQILKMSGERIP